MDNLLLGLDAQINHSISLMKSIPTNDTLYDMASPSIGSYFAIDKGGDVTGAFETGNDSVIDIEYIIGRAPRWLCLHMALGDIDLSQSAVLGLACKSQASIASTLKVCLRSYSSSGFVDAFLPKHIVSFSEKSTHVDLIRLNGNSNVPLGSVNREIVLFFQPVSAKFSIIDMRIFIV